MGFQVKFTDNSSLVLGQMKGNVNAALTALGVEGVGAVKEQMQSGYGKPIRQTGTLMGSISYEKSSENTVTSSHYGDSKGGGDIVWLDDEKRRRQGHYEDDGGDDEITKEKAEMWVNNMMGSDPPHPKGGKWPMEAVKLFAQKYGFPTSGREFYEFYVVMNAMYSDYYDVAKKFGVANPDFFAELAKCFIKDKDANPGKVEMYFKHIAKK